MKYSIRLHIISILLFIVSIVSFSLLSSQYYFTKNLAIDSTVKTFKLITLNILARLSEDTKHIQSILHANKFNKNISLIQPSYEHIALPELIQTMRINHKIHAIHFSDTDHSLYELIRMKSPLLYEKFKAPLNTEWTVLIYFEDRVYYNFLDTNEKLISSYSKEQQFDVTSRPWYQQSLKSTSFIMTQAYKFANTKESGFTFAIKVNDRDSVFAIDYTLNDMNNILKEQKYQDKSEIFLFNKNGYKLASSNENFSLHIDPLLQKNILENPEKRLIKQKDYFTSYIPLKNHTMYLAIRLNTLELFKPFIKSLEYSFAISLLVLLLSIGIIIYASNRIVKPITELILENEKIKHRLFTEVKPIKTNIIEFIALSDSFVSMSKSIDEYHKSQVKLLDSIVQLIAEAVDAKSHYTGGHCERVPKIAQLLVNAASKSDTQAFKEFSLEGSDEKREFEIGAWLHDCGKVTTPEYVVDKATKLETINNRIHEIRTRFEVLWRDAQICYLESKLRGEDENAAQIRLKKRQEKLLEDFSFIASTNMGGEYMSPDKQQKVRDIANQDWQRNFDDRLGIGEVERLRYDTSSTQTLPVTEKLLSDKLEHLVIREHFDYEAYKRDSFKEEVPEYLYNYGEIYNLCIEKGTLSEEERFKINEHVILTIKMLEKIPFPEHMTKIPEYAGTHHETLIGTGYPRKLSAKDLSIPARIMALADVFEALTASDRPYKKAKTLSDSVKILSFMVKDKHLDEDVFKLFLRSDLHNVYAKQYLKEEQIDEVDIEQYL